MDIHRLGHRIKDDAEFLFGESQTVPDQALTVRDIITRFRCGSISIPPVEEGDPDDIDSPDMRYDDIVDAAEDFERGASAYASLMESKQSPPPDYKDIVTDDVNSD
ncbi:hypothetical protein [Dipodfec virus UOA04_Rod_967]|nr:hypothetical protein [Dipodfec virus UOA04_Rod_967]